MRWRWYKSSDGFARFIPKSTTVEFRMEGFAQGHLLCMSQASLQMRLLRVTRSLKATDTPTTPPTQISSASFVTCGTDLDNCQSAICQTRMVMI
jgi:hypothetical protein